MADRTRPPRSARNARVRRTEPRTTFGRRPVLWIAIGIVLIVGMIVAAWFTPVLSVRKIAIEGLGAVPEEQVRAALEVEDGTPLLRLDTNGAAARVAAIPRVAKVRVQRVYPSTVRVTVTERMAAVFIDSEQGTHLLDAEGVDFAVEPPPPGVPRLNTKSPGAADESTMAALAVVTALPEPLRVQVKEVAAESISDISLTLFDDRQIIWGTSADSERKAAVALPLLTQPGRVYIVSSPGLVSVR
ncbi:cell division protein FtsQ/DivIB [Antrihabitans sp. YC2-6]|uniref:cell division protein FtsQ/DivIB n=1 Tax=Antrihabitans sp. YC2-6 TaxID=2799498 RepID=UPI0018F4FC79|nr:FtsQ-type POTRA domain-containing protein [Antrihabitans sp. YC2-6]MBJ8343204.1 FtsQ-type POTRA domain-containing protein [Antrihabitans sp. YC2-6]